MPSSAPVKTPRARTVGEGEAEEEVALEEAVELLAEVKELARGMLVAGCWRGCRRCARAVRGFGAASRCLLVGEGEV